VAKDGIEGHSIVVSAGSEPRTGGVLSATEIVCDAELELPQLSEAVQVRVTLNSCGQLPGVVTSLKVTTGFGSLISTTVGTVKTGVAGHSRVVGPGRPLIIGAASSTSIVIGLDVAGFPVGHPMLEVRIQVITSPFRGV
jgi:hypothetical protein